MNTGEKMDKERRKELMEIYRNCSDDDLLEMIQEGKESYEDGAFELILREVQKRGLVSEADDHEIYNYEIGEEINFNDMSTEDLMAVLINIHALDQLNFHLAAVEAIRRNIDATDIRAYKKLVQCEQCSDSTDIEETEMIENPRPLIILKTIGEAEYYIDALDEEGLPFEIQINVDDRDYKKAEMATNNIILPQEEE